MLTKLTFVMGYLVTNQTFDQRYNGADWPTLTPGVGDATNECGDQGQSPIDLPTDATRDNGSQTFSRNYTNQTNVPQTWDKETNTFSLTSTSYFTSTYGENQLGALKKFEAVQFHWHSGSEHTVDGLRMDAEVHTVHVPEAGATATSGYNYAALGIMFDRVHYSRLEVTDAQVTAIDRFFDDLNITVDETDPNSSTIRYGNLIDALNTSKRWVYSGSVTTPPCATKVYWNVLRTIYPIKQVHLDKLQLQLNRDTTTDFDLRISGNWRVIQPQDTQDLKLIGGGILDQLPADGPGPIVIVTLILVILLILFVIGLTIYIFLYVETVGGDSKRKTTEEITV